MDIYRIKPNDTVDLQKFDAEDSSQFEGDKKAGEKELARLRKRLASLQEMMFAQHKHRLLVVIQAMDTGGKDGAIKDVFEGIDPAGLNVVSFKVPTSDELDHDYLWRVHKHAPAKGEITVFNRSHYEDVLVVRVHNLVPEPQWRKRYAHIREFEQLLSDEGTTVVKFFLHISKAEQKERLEARLADPEKHWKFNLADLSERKLWDNYMNAYQDALDKTSTDDAPWYVVPSNKKWYRNIVVASVLVHTLEKLNMAFPKPEEDLSGVVVED